MTKKVYVSRLPECDFCKKPASFDGKIKSGQWGYMCSQCWQKHGCGKLGVGFGQELKLESEKEKPESVKLANYYYTEELQDMMCDGESATECPEGCVVELDGVCPHGYQSVFIKLGLI